MTDKPTPLNSNDLCTMWGAMGWLNTRCLIIHVLYGSSIGYLTTVVQVGLIRDATQFCQKNLKKRKCGQNGLKQAENQWKCSNLGIKKSDFRLKSENWHVWLMHKLYKITLRNRWQFQTLCYIKWIVLSRGVKRWISQACGWIAPQIYCWVITPFRSLHGGLLHSNSFV